MVNTVTIPKRTRWTLQQAPAALFAAVAGATAIGVAACHSVTFTHPAFAVAAWVSASPAVPSNKMQKEFYSEAQVGTTGTKGKTNKSTK
jgi:hypothetical protein